MNSSIIDKVRKLRALATSSNAHEAAAAAAAADRLIQEHRIAEAELHAATPESPVDGGILVVDGVRGVWRGQLAVSLARTYGCAVHYTSVPGGKALKVYGTPSDVETVKYMFAWLDAEANRLVRKATITVATGVHVPVKGVRARSGWFFGFVQGVREQLRASTEAAAAAAQSSGHGAALVVVQGAVARADAFMRGLNPGLSKVRSRTNYDSGAVASGRAAGSSVHLGKAMSQGSGRLLGR